MPSFFVGENVFEIQGFLWDRSGKIMQVKGRES